MTNNTKNTTVQEQIKNNLTEYHKAFLKIKLFFDKDQYGFFKAKSKRNLNIQIQKTEKEIQQLLSLKQQSENVYQELNKQRKALIADNKKLKESLMKKIVSEVSQ